MSEAGVPGYEVTNWFGIVAPVGTPRDVTSALHGAIAAAMRSPALLDRIRAVGVEAWGSTPDEFALHIERELARWAPIVAGFRDQPGHSTA